jgi:ASC-1-like (ASCH) protein
MAKILKNVQEKYFNEILDDKKRFEVRLADFKCKAGDTLILREQKNGTRELTGRKREFEILSTLKTKDVEKFHTKEEVEKYGFVLMSVRKKYNHES